MTELAVTFGANNGLTGVITQNENYIRENAPIVIILNSGLLHKVGPFRLSVDIARKISEQGFITLRMDISGVGDSKLRLQKGNEDLAVADVKTAMDYLSNIYNNEQFVLMGLCSGSDNSHRTAVVDSRVVGSAHLDGYGYTNKKYQLKHYCARLLSHKTIANKIKNIFSSETKASNTEAPVDETVARTFPPIEQTKKEFSAIIERGVKMLHVYTRGVEYYYNYKNQLKDNISPVNCKNNIEIEYYRYDDHTFSRSFARAKVVNRICLWLTTHF